MFKTLLSLKHHDDLSLYNKAFNVQLFSLMEIIFSLLFLLERQVFFWRKCIQDACLLKTYIFVCFFTPFALHNKCFWVIKNPFTCWLLNHSETVLWTNFIPSRPIKLVLVKKICTLSLFSTFLETVKDIHSKKAEVLKPIWGLMRQQKNAIFFTSIWLESLQVENTLSEVCF